MGDIEVAESIRRAGPYVASAGQTVFTYDFPLLSAGDAVVYRFRGDARDQLELETDYTVTGVGEEAGGTFVLAAPALADDQYVLVGARPIQRLTDFGIRGDYRAADINAELDAVAIYLQELSARQARSVQLDQFDTGGDLVLPPPDDRADRFLGFDEAGKFALLEGSFSGIEGAVADAEAARDAALGYRDAAEEAAEQAAGVGSASPIISEASTAVRTLADRFAEVRNPRDWGAAGNGTDDDTDAFQAIIDDVANVPDFSTIDCTAGKFRVVGLTIDRPLRFWSRDRGLLMPVVDLDTLQGRGFEIDDLNTSAFTMFEVASDWVFFDGLRFEGTQYDHLTRTPAYPYYMINFGLVSAYLGRKNGGVVHCQFDKGRHQVRANHHQGGLFLFNKCTGTTTPYPNEYPAWPLAFTGGKDCTVMGNICEDCDGDGIKVATSTGSVVEGMSIADNQCRRNARDGVDFNIASAHRNYVERNICEDNYASGVEIKKGKDSDLDGDDVHMDLLCCNHNRLSARSRVEFVGDGAEDTFALPFRTFFTPITSDAAHDGDDVTTVFAYSYTVAAEDELRVILTRANGAVNVLILDTDYSVNLGGKTITLLGGALATGEELEIAAAGVPDLSVFVDGVEQTYGAGDDFTITGADRFGRSDKTGQTIVFNAGSVPADEAVIHIYRTQNLLNVQNNSTPGVQDYSSAEIIDNRIVYLGPLPINSLGGHGIDITGIKDAHILRNRVLNAPSGINLTDGGANDAVRVKGNLFNAYECVTIADDNVNKAIEARGNDFEYISVGVNIDELDEGDAEIVAGSDDRNIRPIFDSNTFRNVVGNNSNPTAMLLGAAGKSITDLDITRNRFYVADGYSVRLSKGTFARLRVNENLFDIEEGGRSAIYIDRMTTSVEIDSISDFEFVRNELRLHPADPAIDFDALEANEQALLDAMVSHGNVRGGAGSVPALPAVKGERVINMAPAPGLADYWEHDGTAWRAKGQPKFAVLTDLSPDGDGNVPWAHGLGEEPTVYFAQPTGDVSGSGSAVIVTVQGVTSTHVNLLFKSNTGGDITTGTTYQAIVWAGVL